MGDTEHSVTGELEGRVAPAIALERNPAAVKLVSVELDHHSLRRPETVDLEPLDRDVHRRLRQPGTVAQPQKPALELGPRVGKGPVVGKHGAEPTCALAPVGRLAETRQLGHVEESVAVGLLDRLPEASG